MAQQGATIGRVNVKVMPDTDDFRRALKTKLDQIEKDADFKVKVELDTEHLKASLDKVKRELQDWKKNNDPLKIGVEVNMLAGQTAGIAARLAVLTRPRTVHIVPVLDQGAMAGVVTALSALSGGRVLGDLLENIWDIGKEFDRWVPKLGAVGVAFGGISSWALAAVSNVSALTLSIAQMATAGLALPGLFAGMAVGIGVAVVGLMQMKDVVPQVFDQFTEMKELIGKNFWAEATDGILALTTLYLPQLGTTATATGKFFGAMAEQLSGPFQAAIPAMFDNLNKSIDISTGHAGVFASIITILGQTGSEYLPRLATWFNDISTQFNDFLTGAKADGSLKAFIDSGIQGFKDLGNVIKNAALIIGDISKAAQAGGGSTLGMLADTMERIRAVTASPEFQTTLTSVFQTAHSVMSQIATTAGPAVSNLFKSLADTFVAIGPALGEGLGVALGAIAGALADPALQSGIQLVFVALKDAILALAPALTPVAQALGALAPVISSLLGVIAPLVTAALIPLANIVGILAPALMPLIEVLGGALLQVVNAVAPLLEELAVAIVGLVAAAMPVVNVLLAVLIPAFSFLIKIVIDVISSIVNGLTNMFSGITTIFSGFSTMFSGGWANFWAGIKEVLAGVWQLIIGVVEVAFNIGFLGVIKKGFTVLKTLWSGSWESIKLVASMLWDSLKNLFVRFLEGIVAAPKAYLFALEWLFKKAWDEIKAAVKLLWELVPPIFRNGVSKVIDLVESLPGKAKDALGDLGSTLMAAGHSLIEGFISGITSMIGKVKDTLTDLTSKLTSWKGPESTDKTLLYDAGKLVIGGFINGLESQYDAVRKSLGGLSNEVGNFAVAAPNVGNVSALVDGGMSSSAGGSKVLNYYAAPGNSFSSEEDLFDAAGRARMVGW